MGSDAPKKPTKEAQDTGQEPGEADNGDAPISPEARPKFSRSLEYGVAMLLCFNAERTTMGVADMATALKISRSTAHRYAATQLELGKMEQNRKRKYLLAPAAADPGLAVIETIRRSCPPRKILEDLRDATGYTVSMAMLDGGSAIYLHRLFAHGKGQCQADGDCRAGGRVPVHATAIGKALLASLPVDECNSLLEDMTLRRFTPKTITSKRVLKEAVAGSRHGRIAVSDEEYIYGARSVALTITDRPGPKLAIELTAPAAAYTIKDLTARLGSPLGEAVRQASAESAGDDRRDGW